MRQAGLPRTDDKRLIKFIIKSNRTYLELRLYIRTASKCFGLCNQTAFDETNNYYFRKHRRRA